MASHCLTKTISPLLERQDNSSENLINVPLNCTVSCDTCCREALTQMHQANLPVLAGVPTWGRLMQGWSSVVPVKWCRATSLHMVDTWQVKVTSTINVWSLFHAWGWPSSYVFLWKKKLPVKPIVSIQFALHFMRLEWDKPIQAIASC